jgi:hypothetical protein
MNDVPAVTREKWISQDEQIAALTLERDAALAKVVYYEGGGGVTPYELLIGTKGPQHKFTDEGICIRCGEDAEEWDAGCVEELVVDMLAEKGRAERLAALLKTLKLNCYRHFGGDNACECDKIDSALSAEPEGETKGTGR